MYNLKKEKKQKLPAINYLNSLNSSPRRITEWENRLPSFPPPPPHPAAPSLRQEDESDKNSTCIKRTYFYLLPTSTYLFLFSFVI